MSEFSILIGGKAGFGIDKSASLIGRLMNQLGWRVYIYRDYPSLIRGGHTFSIIRASQERIACHKEKVDCVLALNQETLDLHKERFKDNTIIIYDADTVKLEGNFFDARAQGVSLGKILKEENASEIMRNTAIIGAFAKVVGLEQSDIAVVFGKEITKELELNLKVAARGFAAARELQRIEPLTREGLPLLTGNQAVALGLIKGGLKAYLSYPMTPSSPILHFLAEVADDFGLKVIHPESEIAVMLMAAGFAYMGKKVAVGTSGGGFCLMTEGLSLSGMSELPIVVVLGQRPGPSTGLPTYSSQTELNFALHAGQGEFVRFVVAPGDSEEAYYWSAVAMNMSWKYQIPSIILTDKDVGEGLFNFDLSMLKEIKEEAPLSWDRSSSYKRYADTLSGVSPLAFAPDINATVKVNSYEHDEYGITTESPKLTVAMQSKRLRKKNNLSEELVKLEAVKTYGNKASSAALLCWGSNKGVSVEAAQGLGIKVIQPLVLEPFPEQQFRRAMAGVKKLICVESNATGQLAQLLKSNGFEVNEKILKFDGRPFSLEELTGLLKKVV